MPIFAFVVLVVVLIKVWESSPGLVVLGGLLLVGGTIFSVFESRREQREAQEERRETHERLARMSPEERQHALEESQHALQQLVEQASTIKWGPINPHLLCLHCGTPNKVRSKAAERTSTSVTNTIGRVKATTTTLVTQRHCDKCETTWDV